MSPPHRLSPSEVIRMHGTYHNDEGNFDAIVTSQDSRKLNNEARPISEDKGIPKPDIEEIFKKTHELFKQSTFLDHSDGIKNTGTEKEDKYDRKRFVTTAKINGSPYKITYVVLFPKPNSTQKNTSIRLHNLYIDKQ